MAINNVDLPVAPQSEDYDLYTHEAQRIVDLVLSQSLQHIKETTESLVNGEQQRGHFHESEDDHWQKKTQSVSSVIWPTIAEFTNDKVGLNKIIEYIETEWKTTPGGPDQCWLYAIDFLEKKDLEFTDFYVYRVRFSIPTRRQPIPRHTVSIYFTLDVSKVRPKNKPIEVSFVVETMRLIHSPAKFRFRQKWLENIILLKEKLSQGIDF